MTDTQWPRYMVFQQTESDDPFVHNGTVHAPDAEMALLNARDVFARRPQAYAMWVVPAELVFSKTQEELADENWVFDIRVSEEELRKYHVFGKLNHQMQLKHMGTVEAHSRGLAIREALTKFKDQEVFMWWVFPADSVHSSEVDDVASMFIPFEEHAFKNQAEYPVITMMRQIKAKGKLED